MVLRQRLPVDPVGEQRQRVADQPRGMLSE
jgi:hypothetical protein